AWRGVRREASLAAFAAALMAVLVVLVAFTFRSPVYTAPWWLGTTRPALLGVPAMCLLAAGACWSRRTDDRLLPNFTATAALLVSPRFVELFGGAVAETIGEPDFDAAPREAAEGYREMDGRVIASNVALAEEESVTLGGIVHTYLSVKAPLRDSSGAPCGVFG